MEIRENRKPNYYGYEEFIRISAVLDVSKSNQCFVTYLRSRRESDWMSEWVNGAQWIDDIVMIILTMRTARASITYFNIFDYEIL